MIIREKKSTVNDSIPVNSGEVEVNKTEEAGRVQARENPCANQSWPSCSG